MRIDSYEPHIRSGESIGAFALSVLIGEKEPFEIGTENELFGRKFYIFV